jgi:hypothetical protein
MVKTNVLLLSLAATALTAEAPFGWREIMSGRTSLHSGVMLRFSSVLAPAGKSEGLGGGGIWARENTFHRSMTDRSRGVYFGYDLEIGSGDAKTGYMATFRPLSEALDASLKPLPPPKFPAPQLVHDGDIIALDLMVSPDGAQRLTDYIEIVMHELVPPAATTTAAPRDYTVDDGPLAFDTSRVTFWVDGRQWQGLSGVTGKPGATFWIAVPGQGRYVLSLVPHEGFAQLGAVRDNVMAFGDGAQQFEVRFMSPIAGAGKAWNLYVLHDRGYQPRANQQGMLNSGTDRLENLVPKR